MVKKVQTAAALSALAIAAAMALAPSASAAPPNVSQGYGLPDSGICDATTAPDWTNIPGAPVGGWQKGWGTWLNGGKGGPACVRVLSYSNSTHTWVVGK